MSKINDNRLKIFEKYDALGSINRDGIFRITSTQINDFMESRLMTKFDQTLNLPQIFQDNGLAILPVTRGSYVIGRFNAYQEINYNAHATEVICSFPTHLETINFNNIYSESSALSCALISGMLNDLAGEEVLPTVSGRMSTQKFDFSILAKAAAKGEFSVAVNNSQCEIDGGYEGQSKFLLIEAKNFSVDDFLVRQLYYPYRLWESKISKEIIPVFMTYSNNVFSFFIYQFEDLGSYNSIRLIEQKNYLFAPEQITLEEIKNILDSVPLAPEPDYPFPQADKFDRVVDLMGLLMGSECLSKDYITANYSFNARQTDYYSNAGRYLGLIERTEDVCKLTEVGKGIMKLPYKEKYLTLVGVILSHEVFRKALAKYFENLSPLDKRVVIGIMKESTIRNLDSETTISRRAQTVIKWIEWILDLAGRY